MRNDDMTRLRRSVLAVPGNRADMIEKAAATEADEVFLDLEDAVGPDEKGDARSTVVGALAGVDFGSKTVAVRVNDVRSPWCHDDIASIVHGAGDRVDVLMIPKVDHPGEVWFVEHLLTQLEAATGLERRIGVELMFESGAGATRLDAIAAVTDRCDALVFGPGDYAADLGVPSVDIGADAEGFPAHVWQSALTRMCQVARTVGVDAIDGPVADFRDDDAYIESARSAKSIGCDGKWCIHPRQIPLANEVFTPPHEQISRAAALIAAYEEALAAGRGAATFEGKMIDEASQKMARRILGRGRAARALPEG